MFTCTAPFTSTDGEDILEPPEFYGVNITSNNIYMMNNHSTELVKQLTKLWVTSKYCDVTVHAADGEKFRVHRCVLHAGSPYFANLLTKYMYEENFYMEFSKEALDLVLRYLYTGIIIMKIAIIDEIYSLSQILKIPSLESLCFHNYIKLKPIEVSRIKVIDLKGLNGIILRVVQTTETQTEKCNSVSPSSKEKRKVSWTTEVTKHNTPAKERKGKQCASDRNKRKLPLESKLHEKMSNTTPAKEQKGKQCASDRNKLPLEGKLWEEMSNANGDQKKGKVVQSGDCDSLSVEARLQNPNSLSQNDDDGDDCKSAMKQSRENNVQIYSDSTLENQTKNSNSQLKDGTENGPEKRICKRIKKQRKKGFTKSILHTENKQHTDKIIHCLFRSKSATMVTQLGSASEKITKELKLSQEDKIQIQNEEDGINIIGLLIRNCPELFDALKKLNVERIINLVDKYFLVLAETNIKKYWPFSFKYKSELSEYICCICKLYFLKESVFEHFRKKHLPMLSLVYGFHNCNLPLFSLFQDGSFDCFRDVLQEYEIKNACVSLERECLDYIKQEKEEYESGITQTDNFAGCCEVNTDLNEKCEESEKQKTVINAAKTCTEQNRNSFVLNKSSKQGCLFIPVIFQINAKNEKKNAINDILVVTDSTDSKSGKRNGSNEQKRSLVPKIVQIRNKYEVDSVRNATNIVTDYTKEDTLQHKTEKRNESTEQKCPFVPMTNDKKILTKDSSKQRKLPHNVSSSSNQQIKMVNQNSEHVSNITEDLVTSTKNLKHATNHNTNDWEDPSYLTLHLEQRSNEVTEHLNNCYRPAAEDLEHSSNKFRIERITDEGNTEVVSMGIIKKEKLTGIDYAEIKDVDSLMELDTSFEHSGLSTVHTKMEPLPDVDPVESLTCDYKDTKIKIEPLSIEDSTDYVSLMPVAKHEDISEVKQENVYIEYSYVCNQHLSNDQKPQ